MIGLYFSEGKGEGVDGGRGEVWRRDWEERGDREKTVIGLGQKQMNWLINKEIKKKNIKKNQT